MTSLLLAASFASTSAENDPRRKTESRELSDRPIRFALNHSEERATPATPVAVSLLGVTPEHLLPPAIDLANFNERYWGRAEINAATENLSFVAKATTRSRLAGPQLSGQLARDMRTLRDRSVFSPISVFSFEPGRGERAGDPAVEAGNAADQTSTQARPDLLSGVPEEYATRAVRIAVEENVDPNWVLSIMQSENARFDPNLVSSVGAVGLMQVMPKIGDAFGVRDLADPEQNIRAGTRFLRVLIDKYRNPVLIASAYNAGEPRVDAHQSLPLIRETADYVTRVVGYYTGKPAISQPPTHRPAPGPESSQHRRAGPVDRARSPMLVFSATKPLVSDNHLQPPLAAAQHGGPVKIVKEEVVQ
ncbi:lytic transglycosylase domain-containing protein [Agrobacterium pusense]|uniref:lytic transglycosylase domain-containing protein n=1 Tax=Agrobacterium pusense TaxID=648995 RepID=UPI001DAF7185|nr:soluble lytic murein transglycosylase-like protein [Agrobacterium pusense]